MIILNTMLDGQKVMTIQELFILLDLKKGDKGGPAGSNAAAGGGGGCGTNSLGSNASGTIGGSGRSIPITVSNNGNNITGTSYTYGKGGDADRSAGNTREADYGCGGEECGVESSNIADSGRNGGDGIVVIRYRS